MTQMTFIFYTTVATLNDFSNLGSLFGVSHLDTYTLTMIPPS